ncbi:hypothetical protein PRZ48_012666 [Zasmidium cellare]|uniref:Uncharacterized protein n=1 Tax=Zasmidium cellare TaxID=395010 RepID=A0ABR0E5H6_ZASCE|nr:hypothetical protein PRZ48_012666 [Zasmidium cellare]
MAGFSQRAQTEAEGLAGHLYDFYQYVKDAKWLGGTQEYSGLNEAFPYWLNGLVPLAYTLDDERLKGQVHDAMDYLFEHMIQPDGWIGFEEGGYRLIWARTLIFFAWTNLVDANSTYEKPVVDAMYNFNTLMNSMLKNNGTGVVPQKDGVLDDGYYFWFLSRVAEMIVSLQWLYEKHPRESELTKVWENMEMLHKFGYKWEDWFAESSYAFGDLYDLPESVTDNNFQFLHGVNVGEGLKATAVIRRYTHNDSLIQTTRDGVQWSMKYHGAPSGTIYADEREDGINPYYGAETCTAVEVMFSNSYNFQALGESFYGDGSELAAFNALPGAMTGDWWAHVYMSQANQPYSKNLSTTPFYNTNSVGQTYGLEPNYPCCTVNHPQGLPKFVQAAFVKKGNTGLVHALLSPATVVTDIAGGKTTVECQTNYPFADELEYKVQTEKAFDFYVRVPTCAASSSLTSPSNSLSVFDSTTGLRQIAIPAGNSSLTFNIGTQVRTEPRANDTVAVYRGQLLYALEIGAEVTSAPPKNYYNLTTYPAGYAPPQAVDYTMLNTTEWNVAIDPSTIVYHPANDTQAPLPTPIFAPGKPPMYMTVKACLVDWPLFLNSVPGWPVAKGQRKCLGDAFEAKLVPYGSAKLRMSELPTIDLGA